MQHLEKEYEKATDLAKKVFDELKSDETIDFTNTKKTLKELDEYIMYVVEHTLKKKGESALYVEPAIIFATARSYFKDNLNTKWVKFKTPKLLNPTDIKKEVKDEPKKPVEKPKQKSIFDLI